MGNGETPAGRIRVTIIDQVRGTKVRAMLPANVPISRLIPALVQQMSLPADRPGGGRQEYFLASESTDGSQGERLQEEQTLEEAGIQDGGTLRILPQMTAGPELEDISSSVLVKQLAQAVADEIETRFNPVFVEILDTAKLGQEERERLAREVPVGTMIVEPLLGLPDIDPQYNCDVFVIMPFAEEYFPIYTEIIQPACWELGITVIRGDNLFTKNHIMRDVWSAMNAAQVVVADCTGRNANVFYELGTAHTLGKPTIIITQNEDDIPFDIKQYRHIIYEAKLSGVRELREKLRDAICRLLHLPPYDQE